MQLEQNLDVSRDVEQDPPVAKLMGSLSEIQFLRNLIQRHCKVLKSSPCYENEKRSGYHTFLTLEVRTE